MSKRGILILVIIIIMFGASLLLKLYLDNEALGTTSEISKKQTPSRIISLAPSITEIIYALGLEKHLVGVTRFCNYPKEARNKQEVGGYFDPNYEMILKLEPDLVLLFAEHDQVIKRLQEFNIPFYVVDHKKISSIIASIKNLGNLLGAEKRAEDLTGEMLVFIEGIKKKTNNLSRPRVLISVGRTTGTGRIEDIYIAGANTYFDELLDLAGGENAYDGNLQYPKISAEGIIRLSPDYIFDMIADLEDPLSQSGEILAEWQSLKPLQSKIHVLTDDYVVVPGPRIVCLLKQIAEIIHPDVNWGQP